MTVTSIGATTRPGFIILSPENDTVHMDGTQLIFVTQIND